MSVIIKKCGGENRTSRKIFKINPSTGMADEVGTEVEVVKCISNFQDDTYGINFRAMNVKGKSERVVCTVCGKEHIK